MTATTVGMPYSFPRTSSEVTAHCDGSTFSWNPANDPGVKRLDSLILPGEAIGTKVSGAMSVGKPVHRASEVEPGTLFFALVGSQADGHDFAGDALQKGAAAVVVEKESIFASLPSAILVRSTREAFGLAASRWYGEPSRHFRLVGVTGTNGKTTCTFLLRSIWEHLGLTSAVFGTVENRIGNLAEPATLTTPDPSHLQALFARSREANVEFAAIEVTSIALHQSRVAGSHFEVGLFTNLTQDHLDYHGDMENYYRAKLRFFQEYGLKAAVINRDDPWGQRLLGESAAERNTSFSLEHRDADFSLLEASYDKGLTLARVKTPVGDFLLSTTLIGRHNLYNCLGVLGVTHALGLDMKAVVEALAVAPGAPGRLEKVILGVGKPHVFVDYAHSDDALRNVLRSLSALKGSGPGVGRIITVFGAGGDRDRGKRPKMASVVSAGSDITVATSDNPRTEDPERIIDDIEGGIDRSLTQYHREVDRRRAIGLALSLAKADDLVLIAGKGHETYQILGKEKVPFDDREVIRSYYTESV